MSDLCTDYICPNCGALPGERCHNIAGPIWGFHDERHRAAGHRCAHCHGDPPQGATCPRCGRSNPREGA